MQREKQSFIKRFFGSRLFLLIALVCAILVAIGYGRAYYQDYKIRQEINALQDEVKQLERKKLESMEILKYVTSDTFVEEKARTELNLKKPGENVMVVTNPEVETSPLLIQKDPFGAGEGDLSGVARRGGAETEGEVSRSLSNPLKWWYYFTRRSVTETE